MKNVILLIATAIGFGNLFGQTIKSEEGAYAYLKSNILTIDNLEGIYKYASYTQKNNDEPVRVPIAPINVAIIASGDAFNAYWITNGSRMINQKSFMQIKKRDYIKTLEATFYDGIPKEVEFMSETSFRVHKEKTKSKTDESVTESNIYYFEKIYPTVEDVETERARIEAENPKFAKCTGFLINKNLIVTNLHVVEKAKSIKIKGLRGDFSRSYYAYIRHTDQINDLALLSLEDTTVKAYSQLTINSMPLEAGNDVYVLGYPLTATTGEEVRLGSGIVSSKLGYKGDATSYQVSAQVTNGNVGGPVFDKKGALIGIINYKHDKDENASYCIKAVYLKSFLDVLPYKVKMPAKNLIAAKPLAEKVKILSKNVYLIEVDY